MRRPELTKGQEIEFIRGVDSGDLRARRYKGKVKTVLGDAVQITVTDDRWVGVKETTVRFKDVIDAATGERFSLKKPEGKKPEVAPTDAWEMDVSPRSPLEVPPGESFKKTDLDAWLAMGRDMLGSVDSMIEEKRGEILIIEEDIRQLSDQRNAALVEIKDLEARKEMLSEFYKKDLKPSSSSPTVGSSPASGTQKEKS